MARATMVYIVTLAIILCSTRTATVHAATEPMATRASVGCLFENLGTLDLAASFWDVLLTQKLPSMRIKANTDVEYNCYKLQRQIGRNVYTNVSVESRDLRFNGCMKLNGLLTVMKDRRASIIESVTADIELIKASIPEGLPVRGKGAGRTRREGTMFTALGSLVAGPMGWVTVSAFNRMGRKLKAMNDMISTNTDGINHLQDDFLSFVNLSNARFENVWEGVRNNHALLEEVEGALTKVNVDLSTTEYIQNVLIGLVKDMAVNQQREQQILEVVAGWKRSVLALTQSKLSPELISPAMLQTSLDGIAKLMEDKYQKGWSLQKSVAASYYQRKDILFGRAGSTLYINIPVPLQSSASIYHLYRTHVWPVALNATTSNASMVQDVSDYIAVSTDNQRYYILLSNDDIAGCLNSDGVYKCSHINSAIHVDVPSCTSAIWRNEPELIHKLCRTHYSPYALAEKVINIDGEDEVFITSNDEYWHETCIGYSSPRKVPGCNGCRVKLKCGCTLWGSQWRIPAKITGCTDKDHPSSDVRLHAVNFQYLSMFDAPDKNKLDAASEFNKPPKIQLPDMKIKEQKYENVVSKEKDFKLDLKSVVSNMVQHKESFKDKTDEIKSSAAFSSALEYEDTWWMKYLLFSIIVTLAVGLVYLFVKHRQLGMAVLMLQNMSHVHQAAGSPLQLCVNGTGYGTHFPCQHVAQSANDNRQTINLLVAKIREANQKFALIQSWMSQALNGSHNNPNFPNFVNIKSVRNVPVLPVAADRKDKKARPKPFNWETVYKPMNFSRTPVKHVKMDTVDVEKWYNKHHSAPSSLIVYLLFFVLIVYVLKTSVMFCVDHCSRFKYRLITRSSRLVMCLRDDRRSVYLTLIHLPGHQAFRLLNLQPLITTSIRYERHTCWNAVIQIRWHKDSVTEAKSVGVRLPRSVPVFLPRLGNMENMVDKYDTMTFYIFENGCMLPLTQAQRNMPNMFRDADTDIFLGRRLERMRAEAGQSTSHGGHYDKEILIDDSMRSPSISSSGSSAPPMPPPPDYPDIGMSPDMNFGTPAGQRLYPQAQGASGYSGNDPRSAYQYRQRIDGESDQS